MFTQAEKRLVAGNISPWKKSLAQGFAALRMICASLARVPTQTTEIATSTTSTVSAIDLALEHVMPTGINMYGTQEAAHQISEVANTFPGN